MARTPGDLLDSGELGQLDQMTSAHYSEFGPLADLMADPTIEEVWINSPHRVFIARAGVSQLTNVVLSSQEVRDLVERLLMWGGRRLDLSHPFVDARLPDGSRLHVAIPEVTATHWAVNIRKHLIRGKSLQDLALINVMSPEMADFLQQAVSSGMNILVSGSTQAGKTTLLNALVSTTPFHNRVITIEEVFELRPKLPDCVALQTRPANLQGEGEIPLRKLIKEALRMRPSQIVVGEIREAEALDLLIALNSGLPGMATIHANSARDAIAKLQTLPLLAGENISYQFVAPIVASTINLVVHTTILRESGERRIVEIAHVTGRIENDRVEIEPLFTFTDGQYERGLLDPFRLVQGANVSRMLMRDGEKSETRSSRSSRLHEKKAELSPRVRRKSKSLEDLDDLENLEDLEDAVPGVDVDVQLKEIDTGGVQRPDWAKIELSRNQEPQIRHGGISESMRRDALAPRALPPRNEARNEPRNEARNEPRNEARNFQETPAYGRRSEAFEEIADTMNTVGTRDNVGTVESALSQPVHRPWILLDDERYQGTEPQSSRSESRTKFGGGRIL